MEFSDESSVVACVSATWLLSIPIPIFVFFAYHVFGKLF